MFRSRGENLRSVFILLFLNVAFFMLEHQDRGKFARLFSFNWDAVRAGEVWRVMTYQFTQAGSGFLEALSLFITLLLLYMMGAAIEEEWGTARFLTLFVLSTLGSAGVAAYLGIPLLGSYFVYFSLLFVYAAMFPQQTFYLFGLMPVPVRLLAFFSLAVLLYGVFAGGVTNIAALGGAIVSYVFFLLQRPPAPRIAAASPPPPQATDVVPQPQPVRTDGVAMQNAARYAAMRQALAKDSDTEIARLEAQCERETVPGVNICPPADYKPEAADGYCIRCEGFAECSARYLRMNKPDAVKTA
ncbi:MAG TPA: rhomboid family intramembrane serine protease [Thermoanaerobaculia bacterium]|nr:rhomboid family intramembrane serine protease [Thermoanaerobaculia bacterium]